jgi:cystathionine beta-lyase/cystathionine gamma-synthase
MSKKSSPQQDATYLNHPPAVPVSKDNRPLVAPIYQSVKFTFDDVEESQLHARGQRDGFVYSRVSNPTLRQLELTLAQLQGRESCLVTASGVAATSLALLALCRQGDHVICFAQTYQPTRYLVRRLLNRYGVRHTMLSILDGDALERTLASIPTRLIVFESPTNPTLRIADLPRITAAARQHGALTVLDNTFAGFHNHGRFDIDVYVHSLTKYASGHGDVLGGAIIANAALIDSMRTDSIVIGATLDPHAAFLIQRGLKTYALRYERHCSNALQVAQFLATRPNVVVHYPGLQSHPQHALARAQLEDWGSMVSIELLDGDQGGDQGGDRARRFAEALRLFAISASLGSTESLVQPGELMRPRDLSEQERSWAGITDSLVRLSIGIEAVEDLLADLEQALAAAG